MTTILPAASNCQERQRQPLISLMDLFLRKPGCEVAVVIPLYKTEFNYYEEVSLERCFHVLSRHPIIIVKPTRLDVSCLREKGYKFQTVDFPDEYFENIDSYSRLMLSRFFYESFIDYRYILIYQTDAFVFRDDLLKWCSQGYDYIGAPWLGESWPMTTRSKLDSLLNMTKFTQRMRRSRLVGNGGFSLRKTRSSILSLILLRKTVEQFHRNVDQLHQNEDLFWALDVSRQLPFFKIPNYQIAVDFSIEQDPRAAIQINNNQLPFGLHGWEKWDVEFWRPYFREVGYEI